MKAWEGCLEVRCLSVAQVGLRQYSLAGPEGVGTGLIAS